MKVENKILPVRGCNSYSSLLETMEQNTLYLDKKPTFTYKIGRQKGAVATCMGIVVVAYAISVFVFHLAGHAAFFIVQPIFFIVAGTVHLYIMDKHLQMLTAAERWLYTLTIAAAIPVLFGFSPLWGISLQFGIIMVGFSAFFLPFLLSELWDLYWQISYSGAKVWHLSPEKAIDYPDLYLNGIPVRFRIISGEPGEGMLTVKFQASAKMDLGDIFCDMAQKHNRKSSRKVELSDKEQQPFHWIFTTKDTLLWKRTLDPEKSLRKNRLNDYAVIYAQRVLQTKGEQE